MTLWLSPGIKTSSAATRNVSKEGLRGRLNSTNQPKVLGQTHQ